MSLPATLARMLLAPPGFLAGVLANRFRGRELFCFFATPDMGGAERVHAQIIKAVADRNPVVVFTEPPRGAALLPLFEAHCKPYILHPRRRSRVREYFNEARIAAEINRAKHPVVFGAFSHFFYRLLPYFGAHVRCVDLIHNFGVEFEHFSMPVAGRLNARVVLSQRIKSEFATLYEAFGWPESLLAHIRVIPNAVPAPATPPDKPGGPLRVLYVGRDTPEKRVHLVAAVAAEVARRNTTAEFVAVGEIAADLPGVRREGLVTDADALARHYDQAHVLLLTSQREGLPMAMLEAMARGCVPLVPAVGAIPEHIEAGTNGVLLDAAPADALVKQAADAIERLAKHRGALAAMGKSAHAHVRQHCSEQQFEVAWRDVLGCADG
ncbi:MAG: glycosyltransferase family 4 protein [Planctomycetes bacterium]|nr:glycosyltransferase family 4 protein [Planctomycetota bacterium]MCW8136789.1 glycosyltransferase family 4 protein [Planctomycetota bacterium]